MPYVALNDYNASERLVKTVIKYNGSDWETLGTFGMIMDTWDYPRIIMTDEDEAIVAYLSGGGYLFKSNCNDMTTDVKDNTTRDGMSDYIYPNPTNGLITFHSDQIAGVTLTNALGEILIKNSFQPGNIQIDLSAFNNGIYFMHVLKDGTSIQTKIIKANR